MLIQLFGGEPSGFGSRQKYQSRFGLVAARARLDEPRVLVDGVVGHEVEEHADAALVGSREQRVEVGERPKSGSTSQ